MLRVSNMKKFKAYDILAKIDSKKAVRNQTRPPFFAYSFEPLGSSKRRTSNMVAPLPFFHQFLNAKISNATTCFGETLATFAQDFTDYVLKGFIKNKYPKIADKFHQSSLLPFLYPNPID